MSTGLGLTQRVTASQPRVQPWESGRGYGGACRFCGWDLEAAYRAVGKVSTMR